MPIDIQKIKNRLNTLNQTNARTNRLWKPTGKHLIRIVPYKYNPDNPFIELYFHYNIDGKTYLSPSSFGRPDPINEFAQRLKDSGDGDDWKLGKGLEPKMRTYVPILVRGEEKEGIKFWGFGKQVYRQLLKFIADPDYGDITDPVNGRDITVEFQTAEDVGKSFPETSIMVKPMQTPVSEDPKVIELVKTQVEITEMFGEKTYDELSQILEEWVHKDDGSDEDSNEDEDETPESASESKVVDVSDEVKQEQGDKKEETVTEGKSESRAEDIAAQFDELFNKKKK